MRQIILDTETTGLEPQQGHRIIEFAGLEMINRKLTGRHLHLYFQPEREIDPEAQRVHGISLDFLADKPTFVKAGQAVVDFLRDAELIIHNAPFDVGFLNAEFDRLGVGAVGQLCAGVIDTLAMARDQFPGKRNSLDALCDRFDIDRSNRVLHGALIDCELLAEVYLSMTRGQESLVMEIEVDDHRLPADMAGSFERKPLRILPATATELATHEAYLDGLDKAVKGSCVWRSRLEGEASNTRIALVPAAGSGSRFSQSLPKQYTPLLGRPLMWHTLNTLCHHPALTRVVVVLAADDVWFDDVDWGLPQLEVLRVGQPTRAATVLAGLSALNCAQDDWVLVHDAARCCLSPALISRLVNAVDQDAVGGLLALPVPDTVKRASEGQRVVATLSRAGLWLAQTPQMFRAGVLRQALETAPDDCTDEAQAIEYLGLSPALVAGELANFKLTWPEDLALAQAVIEARKR